MSRIRVAVLVVAALVVGVLIAPTAANAAKQLEVFVTNTVANPVPAELTKPVKIDGQVSVAGEVKVTNPVTVTTTPGKGVVLRAPNSSDLVTPDSPAFYSFDTSALSTVRFAFQSFSGSETCNVHVSSSGVPLQQWNLTGQFTTAGGAYEAPGTDFTIAVHSTDKCYAYVGAWGLPIR